MTAAPSTTTSLAASPRPPLAARAPDAPARRAETLTRIYQQHAPNVLRWARRFAVPGLDPEDLAQEVFWSAFERLDGFEGRAQVSTWLFAITRNLAAGHARTLGRRRRLAPRLDERTPPTPSLVDEVERRDAHRKVRALMQELPVRFREVLLLADVEQVDLKEVAHRLGHNPNTIRTWLFRARRQLCKASLVAFTCAYAPAGPRGL
jgi:RNA polymerase sigma-70 factor (ECF subfamily)